MLALMALLGWGAPTALASDALSQPPSAAASAAPSPPVAPDYARRAWRLHITRVGGVVMAIGYSTAVAGFVTFLVGVTGEGQRGAPSTVPVWVQFLGLGVMAGGLGVGFVGHAVYTIGGLSTAQALRRSGVESPDVAGIVSAVTLANPTPGPSPSSWPCCSAA